MHCKIIQVENEPIPEGLFVTEYDIPDWFVPAIADYVDAVVDKDDALEIVKNHFDRPGIRYFRDGTVMFSDVDYFLPKFDKFKEILEQMVRNLKFDDFYRGMSLEMADLHDAYDDKFGDYIYHDGHLLTLDDFVRNWANRDKIYYVGGVLDYHY